MSIQYAGGTNVHTTFSGVTNTDMLTNIRSNLLTAGWSSILGAAPSTVTITLASPGVFTSTGTAPADGTRVVFSTTGALPTGVTAGTVYFVKSPSGPNFNIAATSGGTAINTSGSQSGTHTAKFECLMQTATTPQGFNIRCRFRDNGSTGIQFSIETSDGLKVGTNSTSQCQGLIPAAGKTWHIVACQYQFMCWVDGDYNIGGEFVCVSCPFVPSFLASGITYIGYIGGGWRSGASNGGSGNWRFEIANQAGDNSQNWFQVIFGNNLWDNASGSGSNNYQGTPCLFRLLNYNLGSNNQLCYRWGNDDLVTYDTVMIWGLTSYYDEPKVRCQLWDSLIIMDQFIGDTTSSFDSHNWICLTSSNTSAIYAAMWLVTP